MTKKILTTLITLVISGCGTMTNRWAPEQIDTSSLTNGSGIVILSTGAPDKCVSTSTALRIQPVGSKKGQNVIAGAPVDVYAIESDFSDHHGFLHAIALPAGHYQAYPEIANPYVKARRVDKAEFSVNPGEVVYIGEYFMPVACTFNTVSEFRDRQSRDLSLLRTKNPKLAEFPVSKRLATFTGCLYGCEN